MTTHIHQTMLEAAMQISADLDDPHMYFVAVLVWERDEPGSQDATGHVLSNVDTTALITLLREQADKLERNHVGGHA